jgi:RNA-splicing ligase RtcB
MLHTGSRGIGHQTCTDHLKVIDRLAPALGIRVPDRQLSCLPVERPEAAAYLGAMHAAGNFALANRHVLADGVRRAFAEVLGRPVAGLGMDLVYDVGHGQARGARGRRAPPHPVRPPQGGDQGQDATAVVETCAQVGLSRVVARLRPAGVLKG